jgi:murein DD-endopeptidase MepM/ murein hydrolase activator NlpD
MPPRPAHHPIYDHRSDRSDKDHSRNHNRHSEPGQTRGNHTPQGLDSQERGGGRAKARKESPKHLGAGAFTFGHAGRQVRLGPVAFWTVVGTLVIMAGWSVVTATYFAFQDDVLARMAARQTEMQYAYEDRLAEMRARIDRVTSRQLLDQEQLEQKLDQVARRQSVLEQRAQTLGNIADPTATGSGRGSRNAVPPTSGGAKASPMSGPALFRAPAMRDAKLDPGEQSNWANTARSWDGGARALLARMTESLDQIEGRQTNALAAMEASYDAKGRHLRAVLAEVGLNPNKVADAAVGGPFVPYRLAANVGPFERQAYRINVARAQVERLSATIRTVPLRKPVDGEIDTSSGFGLRIDPFVNRPAVHTGIDFRGDTGEPIRVTAGGTVVSAGWSGGYGRMVEVDHGNGLLTRYGHLSEIDVKVGQSLKVGQPVGRLGSTGRSTGPHLHYETRLDGEAVDPLKFLQAGAKFGVM